MTDEPTTNLDVTIQAQVLYLIKQLKREPGMSVLLIAHDLGVVAMMADRAAVMYAGKIVEKAPAEVLYANPLHPYTRVLLRAIPRPDRDVEELEAIPGEVPSPIDPPPGCRFHPRCEYAMEKCKREEPAMVEVEADHWVACHLYG